MKTRVDSRQMGLGALAALLIVSLATVAMAQRPGSGSAKGGGFGDGDFGPETGLERLAQRLDLSADQQTAIGEIQTRSRSEIQGLRKQMMKLRNEKRGELLKDDPEAKTVVDLTTRIGDLRTQVQANRVQARLEVRKVLTSEQRDKMLLLAGSRRHGHGPRGEGPRCGRRDHGFRDGRQGCCGNSADRPGQGHGRGDW